MHYLDLDIIQYYKILEKHVVRLLDLAGQVFGVLINEQFYPAITDHRHSLLGLISPDGQNIQFMRTFDNWGKKVAVSGDIQFEKNIPASFAGLMEIEDNIYLSASRTYLAEKGEWVEIDPAIKWQPEKILNSPGNWHPTRYASADPVNFVDPSGHAYQIPASIGGLILGAGVGGVSSSLMSSNTGWEFAKDIGKGMLVGGTTGFFAGLTSGLSLVGKVGTGALLGLSGTAYRMSLDNQNIVNDAAKSKLGSGMILGGLTGGLSTLAPQSPEKFMSVGLGLIESFIGGSTNAVIDKMDKVHTQESDYVKQFDMLKN